MKKRTITLNNVEYVILDNTKLFIKNMLCGTLVTALFVYAFGHWVLLIPAGALILNICKRRRTK